MNRLMFVILVLVGITFGLEVFLIHPHHVYAWWHKVPGFHALLGFCGAVLSMKFAKWLGKSWLYRREDYYRE